MKKFNLFSSVIAMFIVFFSTISLTAQVYYPPGQTSVSTHTSTQSTLLINSTNDVHISGSNPTNVFTGLGVNGGNTGYGSRTAIYGKTTSDGTTGQSAGVARAQLGITTDWFAQGAVVGLSGSADSVTLINAAFSDRTSVSIGGSFSTRIFDPIQNPTVGTYIIAGSRSTLLGNISNYPNSGVVTALYADDQIQGSGTWAGYFIGNGHFTNNLTIGTHNMPAMTTANGSSYKLYVAGGGLFEEVNVQVGWADYVFETDYKLTSLEEVESHIEENGYLHNTPSAKEIEANGLALGAITVNQQEKIEELYLHLIEMNRALKDLKSQNEALIEKVILLEKR